MNKRSKIKHAFMAFGVAKNTDAVPIKRFIGVAPVSVIAVNPTLDELKKIYNSDKIQKSPEYIRETEVNGKKYPQILIDFVVKSDAEKCGCDFTTRVGFFITNCFHYNKDNTKVEVINKYGETTWIPVDVAKTGSIPENQKWFEGPYRPVYQGEEQLTQFIKAFLGIPVKSYKNAKGEVVEIEKKSDAECQFEDVQKFFKGDITEIKNAIAMAPDHKVKVMFGVKTAADNNQYQAAYTHMFLKNNINPDKSTHIYTKLDKDCVDRQAAGSYQNTEFSAAPVREYDVTATDFKGDYPEGEAQKQSEGTAAIPVQFFNKK
jgi:hypothetical protein